jgi:hypothetical protein
LSLLSGRIDDPAISVRGECPLTALTRLVPLAEN